MTQRPTEQRVETLPAQVGRNFRRQAGEQAAERLGPMALQGEEVLQPIDDLLDDLPSARRPASVGRTPAMVAALAPQLNPR